MTYSVVPIVEGQSEVESVPILMRRLINCWGEYALDIERPVRVKRYQVVKPNELERRLHLAKERPNCKGIIIILDADDDCPKNLALELLQRAGREVSEVIVSVVLPKAEIESWFVASIESLRGVHGVLSTAVSPANPEEIRDAKGFLSNSMESHHYLEVDDQPAFAQIFDVSVTFRKCRSFRKFYKDFHRIAESIHAGVRFS